MISMDQEEIRLTVAEHRRRLTADFWASSAQQADINRKGRQWLAWLGSYLIACGQKLATWSGHQSAWSLVNKRSSAFAKSRTSEYDILTKLLLVQFYAMIWCRV